ncbi:hypothetical protein FHL15_009207 [Xylaria flabelliformis]|uniref:Nephrocystin 3-like N-terminal domain-containing protein n=1 Tax=Xylaria flabelliformis TaxID=2512241 RepID=A0A553HPQ3_9PEZI|nr:hypothetical protein FHL15_009207 [Xylaria flabelliformis]
MDRKVFRLRQIPINADKSLVCKLVSAALGIKPDTVFISSLARSVNPYEVTKVATLTFTDARGVEYIFQKPREGSNVVGYGDEWNITVQLDKSTEPVKLIIDTHFKGLTPLYDPKLHIADCIAISGLSSHPFGSWQPKGGSKTFMWIRDDLPRLLPNVRPILYGYDTTLQDHNSFQLIDDLSLEFIYQLKAHGWSSPGRKPLAFLAHSLGGLILKQAIVTAADKLETDNPIVRSVQGVVFFGTPNYGMEQSHLMEMVKGQYNEQLVADLSPNSLYLQRLDDQFSGISFLQKSQLYWCYETKATPTVACDSTGKWTRTGNESILVTRASATRGLCKGRSGLEIIPINENHSGMVKFAPNSSDLTIIIHALEQIIAPTGHFRPSANELLDTSSPSMMPLSTFDLRTEVKRKEEEKLNRLITSLLTPDADQRLREVEKRFQNTFDWIYHLKETQFGHWLQSGTGLFWINGKPGSGKSTLMKFIYQDRRTHELLDDWKKDETIRAAFFFHHRGNVLQKSFTGLLRSILSQIVSKRRDLARLLFKFYEPKGDWSLNNLQKAFRKIVFQDEIPLHLCLFLDALDEYDGQLEFLCKFLKDLGEIQPSGTKTIKVCFSSRPWETFTTAFQNTLGFSIQNFTQADIQDYCLGSMRDESAIVLQELVPNIVSLANGVFLWVKLVIKDLVDATKKAQSSKKSLQEHLNAFPTELDEYYAEIIKRIPYTNRWKAYVMLEVIVRSPRVSAPEDVMVAISSSYATIFEEAVQASHETSIEAEQIDSSREKETFANISRKTRKKIKEYCGGLVEVVNAHGRIYIQVLHQTVEDFVKDPKFKTLVLGDQAKLTVENGHTFIGKALSVEPWSSFSDWGRYRVCDESPLALNLRSAEHTTGRSIKIFLDSVPSHQFKLATRGKTSNPLAFAAYAGLSLYIMESLISTPNLLRDSHEKLLSITLAHDPKIDSERLLTSQDSVTIARLLLNNGFTLDKDPDAFKILIRKIHRNGNENRYLNLVQLFIEHGQHVNIRIRDDEGRAGIYTPLHVCYRSPRLIEMLLDNGANVNRLDSKERTTVDWILEYVPEERLGLYYESISVLLQRGGKANTSTWTARENCLRALSREGFQITCISKLSPYRRRKRKRRVPSPKAQASCAIL